MNYDIIFEFMGGDPVCGDGVKDAVEEDDGNTVDGDGCSANCTIEMSSHSAAMVTTRRGVR